MAPYSKKESAALDAERGISSVARFEDDIRKRLTQEQLLNAANDEESGQEERRAAIIEAQAAVEEEEFRIAQQELIRRQQALLQQKAQSRAQTSGPLTVLNRPWIIGTFSMLAFLQCVSAICSAVGLGLEAARQTVCSETVAGKAICGTASVFNEFFNFFGVDLSAYLPFEMIAYGFWALILMLTVGVFFATTFIEWSRNHRESHILNSTNALFVTTLCVALNLVPILNIFPWIELWGAYWLLGGSFFRLSGLSSASPKR